MQIKEINDIDEGSTFFRYAYKHEKGKIIEYDYSATMINISLLKKDVTTFLLF